MNQHVFVCYAQEDKDFAFELVEKLEELSIPVWIAPRDIPPGADWNKALCDAILECSRFLIVLSPDAVRSKYVIGELKTAGDMDKHMVPVIHRDCEIPLLLRGIQSIYLPSIGPGTELSFKRLIDSLPHEKPSPPEPSPETLPSPPKEPDQILASDERPTKPVGPRIPPRVKKKLYIFLGVLGLLLIAVILNLFRPSGKAELTLRPSGRVSFIVEWMGQKIKPKSNTQTYLLTAGQLGTLRICVDTFVLVDTTLALKEGQKLTYDLTGQIDSLQQMTMLSTVTFVINTEATVRVWGTGEKKGKHINFQLKPGSYNYTVFAAGCDTVTDTMEIKAGQERNIPIDLKRSAPPSPQYADLTFILNTDTKVIVDGKYEKSGEQVTFSLYPGRHTYEIDAKGYESISERVDLPVGGTTLRKNLKKVIIPSKVTFKINLKATVEIEGVGKREGELVTFELEPGSYRYIISAKDYETVKDSFDVIESRDRDFEIVLKKSRVLLLLDSLRLVNEREQLEREKKEAEQQAARERAERKRVEREKEEEERATEERRRAEIEAAKPKAVINQVWVDHNYQGMLIHVDVDVYNLEGHELVVGAFFYYNQNPRFFAYEKVRGTGGYTTPNGECTAQTRIVPQYTVTNFSDMQLYLPYQAIVLPPPDPRTGGIYYLKFDLLVYWGTEIYAEYDDVFFTITK